MWDLKLVKLRNEVDVHALRRDLGEKVNEVEWNHSLGLFNERF
jgi:hypothetical protein